MPRVNHEILKWARESASLDLDQASRKLGIRPKGGLSPQDRLNALETGEEIPTRALLARMAKQYRRPLLVFYLSKPPRRVERGQDFRALPDDHPEVHEAILDALLRDVRARQSTIRSLMEEEDETVGVPFIGAALASDGVASLVTRIREVLRLDLETFRAAPDPDTAFKQLREAAEAAGVFVLLIGDLGSHHTSLSVETFRGFSLSDPIAPVVVLNDHDASSAWSFTLIHELTHLCLGQTAISGLWADIDVERLCNDVASEFLLPDSELQSLDLPDDFDLTAFQHKISEFARRRNISSSMVAYRLFRAGSLSDFQWKELRARFRDLWSQGARERKARNRELRGGPDYYVVRRHRVGARLIDFVSRMLQAGALTTIKAGRLLGVKGSNVHSLVDAVS